MNQYALYLRKSRADVEAEAHGEGETLTKHRTALRAMAEKRGLFILREYAELVSGDTIAARPQMQQLLEDVKSGMYTGVIVNDVDRLGRGDSIDQEIIKITFAASHTLIITPNRDIDPANSSDEDMLDFSMFFARYEYRKISQRMTIGRYRSAAAGNFIASHVPFGYMRVIKDGRPTLEPHPEQAPIVRMIFGWYAAGEAGYQAIAGRLTDMGIVTNAGVRFTPTAIKNILQSHVYIGTVTYGKTRWTSVIENGVRHKKAIPSDSPTVIEDAHPAIISREMFEAVQNRIGKLPPINVSKTMSNPLAGLIVCSECGYVMSARGRQTGKKYIGCNTHGCPTLSSQLAEVETALLAALADYAADYKRPADQRRSTQDKGLFEHQKAQLEKRLAKARELVETGIYSPQEFVIQRDQITAKLKAIEDQIKSMGRPSTEPVTQTDILATIDAYRKTGSPAKKNALLKTILHHADYTKTVRQKKHQPQTFTLDVYPLTHRK